MPKFRVHDATSAPEQSRPILEQSQKALGFIPLREFTRKIVHQRGRVSELPASWSRMERFPCVST